MRAPNGRRLVVRQTDLGPAPWTHRVIDFTSSSLSHFGYSAGNFPTNAIADATYLGQDPRLAHQRAAKLGAHGTLAGQGAPGAAGGGQGRPITATKFSTATVADPAAFRQAQQQFQLGQFLNQGNPFEKGGGSFKLTSLLPQTAPDPASFTKDIQRTAQVVVGHMAGGAKVGPLPSSAGYVNPFHGANVTPSRIDQGVDYVVRGPIRAIGDARVIGNFNYSGFGNYLVYQLTSGPHRGKHVYVAEGIRPAVHAGQRVRAGDVIARGGPSQYGFGVIETGWAQPGNGYLPVAKVTGGYSEGNLTAAGVNFNRLLTSLGVPSGTRGGRAVRGRYR